MSILERLSVERIDQGFLHLRATITIVCSINRKHGMPPIISCESVASESPILVTQVSPAIYQVRSRTNIEQGPNTSCENRSNVSLHTRVARHEASLDQLRMECNAARNRNFTVFHGKNKEGRLRVWLLTSPTPHGCRKQ